MENNIVKIMTSFYTLGTLVLILIVLMVILSKKQNQTLVK